MKYINYETYFTSSRSSGVGYEVKKFMNCGDYEIKLLHIKLDCTLMKLVFDTCLTRAKLTNKPHSKGKLPLAF